MESMATLGCPAYGYGIRYEHGLFRQRFEKGRQVETPEDWLKRMTNPWEFARPESAYTVGFKGQVETRDGREIWVPGETVTAEAHDTPVIGWQGKWANTLRLWAAKPTTMFDLERFNRGDYAAAAEPETLARTLSRVLYPDDTTYQGKELRLKQEFFLTSAALQDILRRYLSITPICAACRMHVAIQMNDTHPAIAGPELIRLLTDVHGLPFADALDTARACLGYTNHTLAARGAGALGDLHLRQCAAAPHADRRADRQLAPPHLSDPPHYVGIVKHHEVRMGELAFVMSHKVNGVSALHSELVKQNLFPELNRLHPGRIINQTNGVTPRRWLKMANRPLSKLITDTIGEGWEDDLDRLQGLGAACTADAGFRAAFGAAKRENKVQLSNWIGQEFGVKVSPDALFDVQIKRIHEYKRQLLNILETIAHWHKLRSGPVRSGAAGEDLRRQGRARLCGGEGNHPPDQRRGNGCQQRPQDGDLLKIVYPPNYNVSMAERLIPASDLSEQISTAGKEASGTGNMKFMMNGARDHRHAGRRQCRNPAGGGAGELLPVRPDAEEVAKRREDPEHERKAIEASQPNCRTCCR
jgi:starch phosphorylase